MHPPPPINTGLWEANGYISFHETIFQLWENGFDCVDQKLHTASTKWYCQQSEVIQIKLSLLITTHWKDEFPKKQFLDLCIAQPSSRSVENKII